MNPIELKRADTGAVVGYCCGECGTVWTGSLLEASLKNGTECCTCCYCGNKLSKGRWCCASCFEKNAAERKAAHETERLAKATKVSWREYAGYVFCEDGPGGSCGEGWYRDVDELVDSFLDTGKPLPAYCWAAVPDPIGFDASRLIEAACENLYEDAHQAISNEAVKELQAFLDGWGERNDPGSFAQDYTRAVLLDGLPLSDSEQL